MLTYGLRAFDIFDLALHQWLENNCNNFARVQVEDLLKHSEMERERCTDIHVEAVKRNVFTKDTNSVTTNTPNLTKKVMSSLVCQILETRIDTKLTDFQPVCGS